MKQLVIGIDFDGTCVTHEYPRIGKDIGAVEVLKDLQNAGVKFVLNTMRCDQTLAEAVAWFNDNGIKLYGANRNPDQNWTDSPKVYANLYIDDAALGCPLKYDEKLSYRPFVNWNTVRKMFTDAGILKKKTVIAVVGESGSGKTWLTRKLHDNGIANNIVSYTTRKMRPDETDGVEHWFVSKEDYAAKFKDKRKLAYTYFGDNHYWTMPSQMTDFATYVIDEKGLIELLSNWSDVFNVVSVYVTRPDNPTDEMRKSRDNDRVEFSNYDYYLENDGTDDFYKQGKELIEIIKQKFA